MSGARPAFCEVGVHLGEVTPRPASASADRSTTSRCADVFELFAINSPHRRTASTRERRTGQWRAANGSASARRSKAVFTFAARSNAAMAPGSPRTPQDLAFENASTVPSRSFAE